MRFFGQLRLDPRCEKIYTGADAYGPAAVAGVRLAKQWIGGK